MALVFSGPIEYPHVPTQGNTTPALSGILIDADGEAYATIVQIPYDMAIATIGLRTTLVSAGGNLDVRVESVDTTTGSASGTLLGTNTNGTLAVLSTDDNVWLEVALTANATVTAGMWIAIVVKRQSGTFNGNIAITSTGSTAWNPKTFDHYIEAFNTGAWVRQSAALSILSFKDSNGNAWPLIDTAPITGWSAVTFNSGSSPDEYGHRFRLQFATRIMGVALNVDADGDFVCKLYDDSWNQLAVTTTSDSDVRSITSNGRTWKYFTSPYVLTPNTWYRTTIIPSSATSIIIRQITTNAQEWLKVLGGGADMYQCSRTDAASPADSVTTRILLSLLLDQFDDGAGAGGIKVPIGWEGGFSG